MLLPATVRLSMVVVLITNIQTLPNLDSVTYLDFQCNTAWQVVITIFELNQLQQGSTNDMPYVVSRPTLKALHKG